MPRRIHASPPASSRKALDAEFAGGVNEQDLVASIMPTGLQHHGGVQHDEPGTVVGLKFCDGVFGALPNRWEKDRFEGVAVLQILKHNTTNGASVDRAVVFQHTRTPSCHKFVLNFG